MATATQQVARTSARAALAACFGTVSVPEIRFTATQEVAARHGQTCPPQSHGDQELFLTDLPDSAADFVDEIEARTAALYIEATCETTSISTLDELAGHIVDQATARRLLLTDEVLARLVDYVIGGEQILNAVGLDVLRSKISHHDVDQRIVGVEQIDDLLRDPLTHLDHLSAANDVACDIDAYIGSVIDPVLAAGADEIEWATERAELVGAVNPAVRNLGPLMLPTRRQLVAQIRAAAEMEQKPAGLQRERVDTMLIALDSLSEHYRQIGRGFNGSVLCDIVYELVWEAGHYLAEGRSKRNNAEHLRERLGGVEPSKQDVKAFCPHIYPRVGSELPTDSGRRRVEPHDFVCLAEIDRTVRDSAIDGVLPGRTALDASIVAGIETFTAQSYKDYLAGLAKRLPGYRLPLTLPEQNCFDLLEVALPAVCADATVVHDAVCDLSPAWELSRQRPDFLVTYTSKQRQIPGMETRKAFIVEADGEGHFRKVHNWSLKDARKRDRKKAKLVLSSTDTDVQQHLVALHHRALAVMAPEQMATLLEFVDDSNTPWVFVRLSGEKDMRAVTGTPIRQDLAGLEEFDVFVLDVPA